MCGRYSLFALVSDVEDRFGATFEYSFDPRYNAAPSQSLPVITNDDPETVQRMEWGLVPSWADDRSEFGFVNARAETLTDRASFSDAYEQQRSPPEHREEGFDAPTAGRCVVPADGFYEWAETSDGKTPYRITLADESVFGMAGLWARWEPPQRQTGLGEFGDGDVDGDVEAVETFTIVTTEPNDVVGELHDRMAVVLDPDDATTWLHGDGDARRSLLTPYDGEMRAYRVPRLVNDPSNDSRAVVEAVG